MDLSHHKVSIMSGRVAGIALIPSQIWNTCFVEVIAGSAVVLPDERVFCSFVSDLRRRSQKGVHVVIQGPILRVPITFAGQSSGALTGRGSENGVHCLLLTTEEDEF